MSIDLSTPAISSVCDAVASPSDPTSWFLLHYTSSTPAQLDVVSAGRDPVFDSWKATLETTTEDVLFGYGEIEGKGLVLVYLTDRVGGVRRARAIVHSRAVAQLFPDHQAVFTISHPSQLTEDLVSEKLGRVPVTPITRLPPSVSNQFSDPPEDASVPQVHNEPSTWTALLKDSTMEHNGNGNGNGNGERSIAETELAPPVSSNHLNSSYAAEPSTNESSPRSISSRFNKHLHFQRPAQTSTQERSVSLNSPPPILPEPQSPTSPASTSGRFKSSSLAKAFRRGRTSSGETRSPPVSPQINEFGGPPVPAKDDYPSPPSTLSFVPPKDRAIYTPPSFATSSGGIGFQQQMEEFPSPPITSLNPSPSAAEALFQARQRRLSQENEIQERFRQDQRRKAEPTEKEDNDDDDDVRLAYDESDEDEESVEMGQARIVSQTQGLTLDNHLAASTDAPAPVQNHAPYMLGARIDAEEHAQLRAAEEAKERQVMEDAREAERVRVAEEQRLAAEAQAEETSRREREREEAEFRDGERLRLAREAQTRLEEEERVRVQEEMQRAEEERARRIEEERIRKAKLEAKRVAEEKARMEAERKRKEDVRNILLNGKRNGGVMLQGWVTVQTTKSMTWRRRYFHLFATEMKLYKAQHDPRPIQLILLGPGATLSEEYDEALTGVKDSFKVVGSNDEEFFLYTDSTEDKQVVLEGLELAMQ
ncbi:hypothetical protein P7C73_g520, partial [Tremellales sp. Uapishka_1]